MTTAHNDIRLIAPSIQERKRNEIRKEVSDKQEKDVSAGEKEGVFRLQKRRTSTEPYLKGN